MKIVLSSCRFLLLMTLLTGVIYPLAVTGVAQTFFPAAANGSLIKKNGVVIGSAWIGQNFTAAKYFWSRPSSIDYNPLPSSGTNLGLTSGDLQSKVQARVVTWQDATQDHTSQVPADLLMNSGSGLDPHISPKAATYQIKRVAAARQLSGDDLQKLQKLVDDFTEKSDYYFLGEPRVNVLQLNLALDQTYAP